MGESYLALLAFYLYGLAAIAVGTFVSSLTESVVISAVVTFALLFLGLLCLGLPVCFPVRKSADQIFEYL